MDLVGTLPLRTKILVLCLACTLLALGLQTWFFISSASSLIFRLEKDASEKSLVRMQDDLYRWIKGYENVLISVYNQVDLMQDLASGVIKTGAAAPYSPVMYRMLQFGFEPGQYVNALYLYTADQKLVSYARIASTPRFRFAEDIFVDPPATRASRVSAYVASNDRILLVTSYYSPSRQRTLVRFVLKVYASNVQTKIAFVVCDVDPVGIERIVEKYVYSDRQLVWLQPTGDEPILVYGNRRSPVAQDYDRVSAAILGHHWNQPGPQRVGNNVYLAQPQQKYDLTAYTLVPQDLLEVSQGLLLRNLLLAALLVGVVTLLAVPAVSRSLTTRLTVMMDRLGEIQAGQTGLRLEANKPDEIGVLGQSINQMLDRIQDLISAEYDVELQLKHAEYKALQAQVNPHFLFNTLGTMAAIAQRESAPVVASLCQAMSQIFRYSLDMKDPLASLADELAHLNNYLVVMNVRTGNSIVFESSIPSDLKAVLVPRLTLQPLVENAIQHGLKNKRGGNKRIWVSAVREADAVIVQVVDNGVGMDIPSVMAQLEAGVRGVTEKNASIGLGNIHARVVTFYGPGCGVLVLPREGGGTVVQVRVAVAPPRSLGL